MISATPGLDAFAGKTVLVTGHTGFKGSWLTAWLQSLGAEVAGLALDPATDPCHFDVAGLHERVEDFRRDVRDAEAVRDTVRQVSPDYVFHLAAQALVRRSYADVRTTWDTNVLGTLNVLQALREVDRPCAAVVVTSDKCYDNVEWVWGYRETDRLGGVDPYSASKAGAELVFRSQVASFFPADGPVRLASARAGNVIGGGDWSPDRIVPDCVRSWSRGEPVDIRNPNATRPWQHVLEPLSGYLHLGAELGLRPELHGESFNFGPNMTQDHSVGDLVEEMARHWPAVRWNAEDVAPSGGHESGLLKLNCDKAVALLSWHALMDFETTVEMTAEWYRHFYGGEGDIAGLTNGQIAAYEALARQQEMPWARKCSTASR